MIMRRDIDLILMQAMPDKIKAIISEMIINTINIAVICDNAKTLLSLFKKYPPTKYITGTRAIGEIVYA